MTHSENPGVHSLFTHPKSDTKLFSRINCITAARVIRGELWLEIDASGGSLPPNWLTTLLCSIVDPATGVCSSAPVRELVRQENGRHLVVTGRLAPAVSDAENLSAGTLIRVSSSSSKRPLEQELRPLLKAKP